MRSKPRPAAGYRRFVRKRGGGQWTQPIVRLEVETLSLILIVILAIIWISLAFWPARVAARKGHSWLGYFIFSLFLWPIALIVAYASDTAPRHTRPSSEII